MDFSFEGDEVGVGLGFGVGVAGVVVGVSFDVDVGEEGEVVAATMASISSSSLRSRENLPDAWRSTLVSFAVRIAC